MYDATIHAKTIGRQIKNSDLAKDKRLFNDAFRTSLVNRAIDLGRFGFTSTSISGSNLRGKTVYQLKDLAELLVIRHITRNIRGLQA